MRIVFREVKGVTVLELHGRVTIGDGADLLSETVSDFIGRGKTKIVLDLGNVSYVDSIGLAEIVRCYTNVSSQGGKLKLLKITKKIEYLLIFTRLRPVFDIYDTEEEAVASFTA